MSPIDSADNGDVVLGVAGQASGNIDISKALADALPIYLAVVIGLSILIMIVVFRSILVPIIATGGFLLSFVVRLLLMPALMHLLGKSAWWLPRWLARILPNVDVEGASLERDAAASSALHGHR